MDPVESAACVIIGVFALLFSWDGYSRRTPAPAPTATTSVATTQVTHQPAGTPASDEVTSHVREACQIHARWSGATGTHVACFDLFGILQTDGVSFSADVDAFAAVMGPAMDENRYVHNAYHSCVVGPWLTGCWGAGAMMRRSRP